MKGRQKGMNPCGTQKETDTATSLTARLYLSPSHIFSFLYLIPLFTCLFTLVCFFFYEKKTSPTDSFYSDCSHQPSFSFSSFHHLSPFIVLHLYLRSALLLEAKFEPLLFSSLLLHKNVPSACLVWTK